MKGSSSYVQEKFCNCQINQKKLGTVYLEDSRWQVSYVSFGCIVSWIPIAQKLKFVYCRKDLYIQKNPPSRFYSRFSLTHFLIRINKGHPCGRFLLVLTNTTVRYRIRVGYCDCHLVSRSRSQASRALLPYFWRYKYATFDFIKPETTVRLKSRFKKIMNICFAHLTVNAPPDPTQGLST